MGTPKKDVESLQGEPIDVDDFDFPHKEKDKYLFIFQDGLSGQQMFDLVMSSKYVVDATYSSEVAFYCNPNSLDWPIFYKDFQKYRDKMIMTTSFVSAFSKLLESHFRTSNNKQRFADCSLWTHYLSKPKGRAVGKLSNSICKYVDSGDKYLYVPMLVNNYHFILSVILMESLRIHVFDSFQQTYKKEVEAILSSLKIYFKEELSWEVEYVQNIPRQTDGHSCAFFTCWYAYQHAFDSDVPIFPDNVTIDEISKGIMISLLQQKPCSSLVRVCCSSIVTCNPC
jgi:Ulp1 family protease